MKFFFNVLVLFFAGRVNGQGFAEYGLFKTNSFSSEDFYFSGIVRGVRRQLRSRYRAVNMCRQKQSVYYISLQAGYLYLYENRFSGGLFVERLSNLGKSLDLSGRLFFRYSIGYVDDFNLGQGVEFRTNLISNVEEGKLKVFVDVGFSYRVLLRSQVRVFAINMGLNKALRMNRSVCKMGGTW